MNRHAGGYDYKETDQMANVLGSQSPLQARSGQQQPGKKKKRPPSQASGQADRPLRPGEGPVGSLDKKIKKKAKNVGNALLPGNPFG